MVVVVTYTSLLITSIIAVIVFTPPVVSQIECKNGTKYFSGYLDSPDYPNNYGSSMDCQWEIATLSPQQMIVLELLDFSLEGSQPDCTHDYVAIYDGSSTSSSRIQLLCGQVADTQFTSTGSYMTVVFHSDGSNNFKGFKFRYSSEEKPVECNNGTKFAYGYLDSPGYPYGYGSSMNCQWEITTFLREVIVLELLDFSLEGPTPDCTHDYVEIYDGSSTSSSRIQLLCGQVADTQFTSTGSYMTVVFHSDGSNNFKGFKFRYSSKEKPAKCNNGTKYFSGDLDSPGYPNNYGSSMDCQWEITTFFQQKMIVLDLLDFTLEGSQPDCTHDYVAIYDGSSTSSSRIQLLCGQVADTQFTSTGSYMTVVFHSDGSNNFKGFKFRYSYKEKPAKCNNGTKYFSGDLDSPGYPNNYGSSMDCQWEITTFFQQKMIVLDLLDFTLEGSQPDCTHDYVAIYDGSSTSSSRIQLLCGQVADTQFTSTGSYMTVVFHSDGSNNFKGFKFRYSYKEKPAKCNNGTKYFSGDLDSPGYPNNYGSSMDCQWEITTFFQQKMIVLDLLDFTLEGSQPDCTHDYVAIYDGSSTSSSRIQLLCGQVADTQFTSTGSYMTVVFHSDGSNNFKGFKFRYSSQEKPAKCNNGTKYFSGYLDSPDYPNNYGSSMDCQWEITTLSPQQMIVLELLDFTLEGSQPDCTHDYVAIYDGSSTSSSRIQLLCGKVADTQFTSTGSYMTVVFHSDWSNNFKGFRFRYSSEEKPVAVECNNGTKYLSGYLDSPGYPNNYGSSMDCQWEITTFLQRVIVLDLLDFSLEGPTPDCTHDYVEIYDGSRTSSSRIQLLCGQVAVTKFTSTSLRMIVVFHSDGSNNFKGFRFSYSWEVKPGRRTNDFLLTTEAAKHFTTPVYLDNYLGNHYILLATPTSNYLTSPGYPNKYPSKMDYQWKITSYSSYVIVLTLLEFHLAKSSNCTLDYLSIYDGPSISYRCIEVLCGEISARQFVSSYNDMTVIFHSEGKSNTISGFNFTYQTQIKVQENKGLNHWSALAIYLAVPSSITVVIINVIIVICARRRREKQKLKNSQNRTFHNGGSEATVRETSLSVVTLMATERTAPPHVEIEDSQSTSDPPPYSSLNFSNLPDNIPRETSLFVVNLMATERTAPPHMEMEDTFDPPPYSSLNFNNLPDNIPRIPEYTINDLPPPYSYDSPVWAAHRGQTTLFSDSRSGRPRYGVGSTSTPRVEII